MDPIHPDFLYVGIILLAWHGEADHSVVLKAVSIRNFPVQR